MGNICKVSLCSVTSKYEISVGAVSRSWQGRAIMLVNLEASNKIHDFYWRLLEGNGAAATVPDKFD